MIRLLSTTPSAGGRQDVATRGQHAGLLGSLSADQMAALLATGVGHVADQFDDDGRIQLAADDRIEHGDRRRSHRDTSLIRWLTRS